MLYNIQNLVIIFNIIIKSKIIIIIIKSNKKFKIVVKC